MIEHSIHYIPPQPRNHFIDVRADSKFVLAVVVITIWYLHYFHFKHLSKEDFKEVPCRTHCVWIVVSHHYVKP